MKGRGAEAQFISKHNKSVLDKRRKKKLEKSKRRTNKDAVDSVVSRYSCLETNNVIGFKSFLDFPLSKSTQKGLSDNNFKVPTEIQRDSLIFSLRGVDVVGAAKTGSGKTLAFLIPMLECLWRQNWSRNVDGLGAIVITPTRELAYQIFHVLNKIGAFHQFSAALLIGGNDVTYEKPRVGSVNIIISTPGRLLQHMDENSFFSCDQLQMLVIDEADRILDLGFASQMNAILSNLSNERQTLLFSATQTKRVKELMRLALKDPVYVSVHENALEATPDKLQQSYVICADEDKINFLWSFLVNNRKRKSLIFVSSCKQARFLTKALCHLRPGLSLYGLWGTMKQSKRIEVFEKFNRKTFATAMIATDVASRGLDFARVDWVLQLDCPATVEDYIHRVGRTARMDAKGEAVVVFTSSQKEGMLQRFSTHKIPINEISVDPKKMYDISGKLQTVIIQFQELKSFAQQSFLAYIRSIYLMQYKDVFDVKNIDVAALARSYGLSTTPRLRFLNRSVKDKVKKDNNKQYPDLAINVGEERKSVTELVEMLTKSSNAVKNKEETETPESDSKELRKSEKLAGSSKSTSDVTDGIGESQSYSDDDSDDVLKIRRHDVFNVLKDSTESEEQKSNDQKHEQNLILKKPTKPLTRQAAAKKVLRKGVRVNKKKVFTEEGDEVRAEEYYENELEKTEEFDLGEAMREMAAVDKLDKAAYKEKLKKWRTVSYLLQNFVFVALILEYIFLTGLAVIVVMEKKLKLKKRLEGDKEASDGGAVLDLGEGEVSDEEPDLSWLPDPDNPKKYDASWNEITSDREMSHEENEEDESENGDECKESSVQPKNKRRKVLANMEDEALRLLGYDK
uniref:ATP-dependent RNA helicase n=1 Tax=Syphacia muris TaxID=451379 RepID=A0A0N5AIG4_9BILA